MKTQPSASNPADMICVRGAREHNLKNVSVSVPRDKFVVMTGVSGSGKSSLAFGTIYAEAQRRYLESVSPYARRLFNQMPVPVVDAIEGLPQPLPCSSSAGAAVVGLLSEASQHSQTSCACCIRGQAHILLA